MFEDNSLQILGSMTEKALSLVGEEKCGTKKDEERRGGRFS